MSKSLISWLTEHTDRADRQSKSRRGSPLRQGRFRPDLALLEDRTTPAQLWVGSLASLSILNDAGPPGLSNGDLVRVDLTGGQYTTGIFGSTTFSTVEAAVLAANANGDSSNTIHVLPGTFTLGVAQVAVTKELSIVGSGQGATTIRVRLNTTTGGGSPTADTSAAILVNRGVSLNLSALTLDGQSGTLDVPVLIRFSNAGAGPAATSIISGVEVQNVGTPTGTATTAGVGLYVANGNVTITGSLFQNIGTHAVLYSGVNADGSVLGSVFEGLDADAQVDVAIGAENLADVTIQGNTISGFVDDPVGVDVSSGVQVVGGLLNSPTVTVSNNLLTGNATGVQIGALVDLTGLSVIDNNILNSTVAGISSLTSGLLPGLQNFYQGNVADVLGCYRSVTCSVRRRLSARFRRPEKRIRSPPSR